jgi:hypothetical protein
MARPPTRNSVLGFLSHPLFLLVVGSVIGSFLIPRISEQTGKKRVLQDARLRKAVEIVDNNTRTSSELNSIVTRLATFHDENVRLKPSPAKLSDRQDKLAEEVSRRYEEFEKTGWWWYRDLIDEAVILELVPATGSDKLREHVNAYGANILQTVNTINELRHSCLAADYDYKDGRVTKIKEDVNTKLSNLFNARNDLVNHLVGDFRETR